MKARKAIDQIDEIMNLEYNGFGEPLEMVERFSMIFGVLDRYKKSQNEKMDPR